MSEVEYEVREGPAVTNSVPPLSRGGQRVEILGITLFLLQILLVALFYVGRYMTNNHRGMGARLVMPLALFCQTANIASCLVQNRIGLVGYPIVIAKLVKPGVEVTLFKAMKASEYTYSYAILVPKLIILQIYHTTFTLRRTIKWANCVAGFLVFAHFVVSVSFSTFSCEPYAKYWNDSLEGTCMDMMLQFKILSGISIAANVMLLAIPWYGLRDMQFDHATRMSLTSTFGVARIGVITSLLRLHNALVNDITKDPTAHLPRYLTYSILEPAAYLLTACCPALRAIKRRFLGQPNLTARLLAFLTRSTRATTNQTEDIELQELEFITMPATVRTESTEHLITENTEQIDAESTMTSSAESTQQSDGAETGESSSSSAVTTTDVEPRPETPRSAQAQRAWSRFE